MALGLGITGGVATWLLSVPALREMMAAYREAFIALFFLELLLVWWMAHGIERLSLSAAVGTLLGYAALNGVTWAALFSPLTGDTVAIAFYVSSAVFAGAAVYGILASKDMTRAGNIRGLLLLGIPAALSVNYLLGSGGLCWIVSLSGAVLFTCLTVSDLRHIRMMSERAAIDRLPCLKSAAQGALLLYLDFMNLFLLFLRIAGGRRLGL